MRPAPNVPDTADALDVLEVIKGASVHMALVHDEYGHFQGVVTNADILEAIVGGSQTHESEPDAVQREDGSWLIAGSMPRFSSAMAMEVASSEPGAAPHADAPTDTADEAATHADADEGDATQDTEEYRA